MGRQPFVWEVQIPRDLLAVEVDQLRDLPYSLWRTLVGERRHKLVASPVGRTFRVDVRADWSEPGSSNVRVVATLRPRWGRRAITTQSFVISPDNKFLE